MPVQQAHKRLGQNAPAAATPTSIYSPGAGITALLQNLHICNTSTTTDDLVRLFLKNGAGPGTGDALIYDLTVPVGNPFALDTILAIPTGWTLYTYSLNATTTFTASGIEISGSSNQTFKQLAGPTAPGAASNTTIYTATGLTAQLASLHICNTNATSDMVRVFIVPSAGTAGVTNAIMYDVPVAYGNPFVMNTIPDLNAGDFISVYSLNGTSTFTLSGTELS